MAGHAPPAFRKVALGPPLRPPAATAPRPGWRRVFLRRAGWALEVACAGFGHQTRCLSARTASITRETTDQMMANASTTGLKDWRGSRPSSPSYGQLPRAITDHLFV